MSPNVDSSSNSDTLGLQNNEQQRQWEPASSALPVSEEAQKSRRTKRRQSSPSPDRQVRSRNQQRLPLLGLPPPLVDQLLAVYFTHVHVSGTDRTLR